jgi:hypothetical protein
MVVEAPLPNVVNDGAAAISEVRFSAERQLPSPTQSRPKNPTAERLAEIDWGSAEGPPAWVREH